MITISTATQLSDDDLVSAVTRVVAEGRSRTADLIALLVALETRTVHVEAGYASLFRFCVGRLRLSEEEAFYRIAASRVAARFPVVLERLREGRITLTAVALLRKHLTDKNYLLLLDAAEGRSKREVQVLIASLAPQPDLPVSIRRLPSPRAPGAALGTPRDLLAVPPPPREDPPKFEPTFMPLCVSAEDRPLEAPPGPSALTGFWPDDGTSSASSIALPAAPPVRAAAVTAPLSPGRYSLRLTISEETHSKLRRAEDLLAHVMPGGDTAAVLDRALTLLLAQLERKKYGALLPQPKKRGSPVAGRPSTNRPPAASAKPAATEEAGAGLSASSAPPDALAGPPGPEASAARTMPGRSAGSRDARYIPAAVRREVWQRDGGQCGYVGPDGNRCEQTSRLEFHHTIPLVDGGATTAAAVVLRCRQHHFLETRRWFGEEVTADRAKRPSGSGHPGWP